ncbi:TonB-dependent receptor [Sphingomonas sp. MG17]|uniref:TonB-dependent receptor n=1 Tax=Sphingomonas tagetis TaxID=2949092 RepID=A0A9X2HN02_9SPHN|nr:TonB-dependent receptor [Sphingomonas tagetis]MCP3730323.1 TonB-dependent receptor [Sphingomonas tagetis]
MTGKLCYKHLLSASLTAILLAQSANAQERQDEPSQSASEALVGEIVVTATKKADGESLQEVPAAVTAYGSAQLEAVQFRSLESLAYSMPSVQLDPVGTQKGVANFTIRGLGVNSSVPSIEPTVGTFVDGVYLGTNYGVVFDTFDIDSVEVLRGPQGVLFGRNVTGGAVSLRTSRPDGKFRVKLRASAEASLTGTGVNQTYAASVEGTLADTLFAKVTGYFSDDGGYFRNITLNRNDGKLRTWFVRPTLVWNPGNGFDMTLIGEHGNSDGDGGVQSNPRYAGKFEVASNDPGFTDSHYNALTHETNIDVGVGDGQITNIIGYREFHIASRYDADGSPTTVYHIAYSTRQNQFSNELRYAGRFFDRVDLVAGLYYFTQNITYLSRDDLRYANLQGDFGGRQYSNALGAFANADIDLFQNLTLGIGTRISRDYKRVAIATRRFANPQPCDIIAETCTTYDFRSNRTFNSFTPRVSLKYEPAQGIQLYGSYSKGARSGGYNLRSVTTAAPPGPFNDEKLDSFEVGFKGDLFDRRLRLNISAYDTKVNRMQREQTQVNAAGTQTVIANTADARLRGFEAEATVSVAKGLVFKGSVGYVDGKYTRIIADISGDGIINATDLALKIPRLAPWTYSASLFYDTEIGSAGSASFQLSFDHRDGAAFNDRNVGFLPAIDNLYTNLAFEPEAVPGLKLSIYGKNLLNERNYGTDTPLGSIPSGGSHQTVDKGRVFGIEVNYKF